MTVACSSAGMCAVVYMFSIWLTELSGSITSIVVLARVWNISFIYAVQ